MLEEAPTCPCIFERLLLVVGAAADNEIKQIFRVSSSSSSYSRLFWQDEGWAGGDNGMKWKWGDRHWFWEPLSAATTLLDGNWREAIGYNLGEVRKKRGSMAGAPLSFAHLNGKCFAFVVIYGLAAVCSWSKSLRGSRGWCL